MNVLQHFQHVKIFVFDVDGVLTNGRVLLLENGLQAREMHVKDGLALQMALRQGYRVVIVSGAASEPVINRFRYLGIEEIHLGIKDKLLFMQQFLANEGMDWEQVLFMGDDLPDLGVLQQAGLSCCPADAAIEVVQASKYISASKGGEGCVRDVIEKVLRLHNKWNYDTQIASR